MREGWTYKKLGEVCEYAKTRIKSRDITIENYIGVDNLLQNCLGRTLATNVPEDVGLTEYRQGDVLIGNIRPYLKKIWLADRTGGCNGDVLAIRRKDRYFNLLDTSYLYKCLSTQFFFDFAMHYAKGEKMPRGDKKEILDYPIPVPHLSEQERIISELDLLSGIIEKKKEQLKEYDQLAQSIFYDMFGDPVTNEKGWEVKKLGDVAKIGTGATPSREKEELYYGGDIHWVKTTEVHNCEIINTEERITLLAIEETNCKIYPPNTLLMAMYGQGKTRGQIAKLKISAATNQACAAIILDEKVSNLDFIYTLLLIKYEDIRAMAQGGNQANLNMKLVGSIPVIIPSLELQDQFASKIDAIEKQKALIKQSITETETLFNSRMDYYFN